MSNKYEATFHGATCPTTLVIDFDSINCTLPHGHAGMHNCNGEGGQFYWVATR